MKRFFAFTVAAMLAGQAWAESSEPIGDSDWSILCLNGNYTAEIIYNGIRVIYEGENLDIWNMQLITPRWENIGQVGDAFKLEFDVLYEGEVDTAKLQIESGKNYVLDGYSKPQVGNTQLVDEAGYPEISYRNSYVDVPNGEITHYECSYFLGEDGANVVQLEIDFGFNSGTYIFSNIQLTVVAGEVVTEEDFTIEPKILQDALGFLQDSVIQYEKGEPKTKSIYGYDDRNNKILETVYAWNAMTKTWDNYCKYENAYDADNKHILANSYVWDRQSNAWQNSGKLEFLHNEEGNEIVGIQHYWSAKTNSWICKDTNYYYYQRDGEFAKLSMDSYKTETEYDANGNETLSTTYRWNPETNSWTGSPKTEYAYDANGNQTLYARYNWNPETNSWVGESKYEKEYDANGNKTLSTTYRWNYETNSWISRSKTERAYDANGNQTLYASYNWNPETNSWVCNNKEECTFDANGNLTLLVTSYLDTKTNSWMYNSKTESTNDNGASISVGYYWSTETNSWVCSRKEEYSYDDNGVNIHIYYDWDEETNSWVRTSKTKMEIAIDDYGHYLLVADYNWNPETNSWIGGQRMEHDFIYYDDGRTYYEDYRVYFWKSDTWVLSYGCTSVFDDYDNTVISVQYRWDEEIKSRVIWGRFVGYYYWEDFDGYYYWEGGRDYSESTVINVELDSNRVEFVFKEMDTNTNELVKSSEYYFRILKTVNTENNQSGNENQGGNQQGNGNQSGNENQGGNQQGNQNGNENQGGENNNQNGSGNQSGNENQGGNGNQNNENQESVANTGFSNGYKDGYSDGYSNGLAEGRGGTGTATAKTGDADYNEGYNDGYKDGYKEGFKEGRASTTVVSESAAAAVNIYAYGNTIVVENAQDEIRIYDAMGRLFCREAECRVRTELQVNTAGVYIVKTGSVAKRVVIQF